MPEIVPDDTFSDFIISQIMGNYLKREGRVGHKWHVSDLLFPRYAVMDRLYGRTPSRDDIGFFFTGEAYHEFLQKLLGKQDAEVRGEILDVLGTADYFDGNVLLEIKTSRKWTIPETPQEHYVEQVGYYCAIFGKIEARILIIFPTAGRKWDGSSSSTVEVRTWKLTFTDAEIADIKAKMASRVVDLNTALAAKNVSGLPACPDFKYGTIERDSEKKIYFLKIRCPYANAGYCDCGEEMRKELQRKNDARRIKPEQGIASRYKGHSGS